jgi:flagellar hook-basal body complex protein FliE
MSINSVAGNNAYAFVQKAIDASNSSTSGASGASGASGGGFGDMVGDALKSTFDSVKASETVSANAMTGKASLTDVVTAVNGADVALKSVVAIRDKVISAYQDIIKMPM